MGKFINTEHKDMIDTITKGVVKDILKNPYYLFENTNATPVIFYELSSEATTLDDSTRLEYEDVGRNAPTRYKKIEGVYLYGLSRVEIKYNNGESGLEADPITGECTDLPHTINPTPGCYFEIPYLNKGQDHYLFKITEVSDDTLDNGENFHKMSYELDMTHKRAWDDIQKQVIEDYKFIPSSVGTQKNSVILSSKYELAEKLDDICTILRQYYRELFYNDRVQTFTFKHTENCNINDSMVVEFIMRNNLMAGSGMDYLYVSHKRPVSKTFSIDYAKSIFAAIESGDRNHIPNAKIDGQYRYIDNMATIFETRQEPYFYMDYNVIIPPSGIANAIRIMDSNVLRRIYDNELYSYDSEYAYYNIIIKYMNGMIPVTSDDVMALEAIEYDACMGLYYAMPIIIYCVERYIKSLIAEHTVN